jgi:hypothetical protein
MAFAPYGALDSPIAERLVHIASLPSRRIGTTLVEKE